MGAKSGDLGGHLTAPLFEIKRFPNISVNLSMTEVAVCALAPIIFLKSLFVQIITMRVLRLRKKLHYHNYIFQQALISNLWGMIYLPDMVWTNQVNSMFAKTEFWNSFCRSDLKPDIQIIQNPESGINWTIYVTEIKFGIIAQTMFCPSCTYLEWLYHNLCHTNFYDICLSKHTNEMIRCRIN